MSSSARESKSDRTRGAIVSAARALFAENGYDRTTVRDIAALAAVDPAMVIRHFGSKHRLFAVVSDFDLALPDLASVPREKIGETVMRHFLALWEGEAGNGLAVLLRSAASNPQAAERLRRIFTEQTMPVFVPLSASRDMAERAGLISSALLGLALCRYVVRLPPVADLPLETIVRQMGETIHRYAVGEE